jgi:glycosyltransferase involved in cell wall biosynthesis
VTFRIAELPIEAREKHGAFLASPHKHVLMITNHGIHEWQVVPGLPDTGGQNIFVNQFTAALARLGFKITIANRGGYAHPVTGVGQRGLVYWDERQRILYLEDDRAEFVRKEDMHEQIPALVEDLRRFLDAEATGVDLILSHYWDAARIGVLYNRQRPARVEHVWVPHSLGTIKKRNMAADRWADLRLTERIAVERDLLPDLDGIAATSSAVRQALASDYGYAGPDLFLPPCVDPERYHPRRVAPDDGIWHFLSQQSGLSPQRIQACKIVTEISRTDTTKRKDVLIRAFARAHKAVPDSFLVVSIDPHAAELARDLRELIDARGIQAHTAVVGSIWDLLPTLYAITDVYCTPSVMEGFGMSAQEAAATAVPVVASHLVPFVVEYLLGPEPQDLWPTPAAAHPLQRGSGAIVVQADEVQGFAHALEMLLSDDDLRLAMGHNAYRATIPYFTWPNMVSRFLKEMAFQP